MEGTVTVSKSDLANLVSVVGFVMEESDTDERFGRVVKATCDILRKRYHNSFELLCDKLPLEKLPPNLDIFIQNLVAEYCMLRDRDALKLYVLRKCAELVMPPFTYKDIDTKPEIVVAPVRELREFYEQHLRVIIGPQAIENESRSNSSGV